MIGEIPQTSALSEASSLGDSLSEAVSRFDAHIVGGTHSSPEARAALRKIIEANRLQRERWEAAERQGGMSAALKAAKPTLGKRIVGASAADLGL